MVNTRIGGAENYKTSLLLDSLKNKELDQLQYTFPEIEINSKGYADIVAPDASLKYAFAEIINWTADSTMTENVINICGPSVDGGNIFYLISTKPSVKLRNILIRFFYYKNR